MIKKIKVIPKSGCVEDNCHNNVNRYISYMDGERLLCLYIDVFNEGIAFTKHSVWKSPEGVIIDITPFADNRMYNYIIALREEPRWRSAVYKLGKIMFFR